MPGDWIATGSSTLVRVYYDACNAGDVEAMAACFTPDARHYFPAGAPQGTFMSAEAIGRGWADVVGRLDSRWTIDHLVIDVETREVAIEWTHWKPARAATSGASRSACSTRMA